MPAVSLLSLTSISQLLLFLGIGMIIFGWVEKKQNLIIAGQAALFLLGLFALWVLFGQIIQIPATNGTSIPKEVRLLVFFKASAVLAGLSLISVFMSWRKIRFHNAVVAIAILIALALFFMLVSIGQMPANS